MFMACNQGKISELEQKNKALMAANYEQDSILNDFMGSFNAFEDNISAIKERENLIGMNSDDPELRKDGKDQVLEDLQSIDDLLNQNRQIIEDLNQKIEQNETKMPQLRRLITRLKSQLEEKDGEVIVLKEQLAELNYNVEELNLKVNTLASNNETLTRNNEAQTWRIAEQDSLINLQGETIGDQTNTLNTAYYITGTYKDLKKMNVLTATGGFIGIGRIKQLLPDFDESGFQKIDITEVKSIPVDTKKAQIMTSHPSGSYVFNEADKRIEGLEITDPETFWKNTKYLVVVTN